MNIASFFLFGLFLFHSVAGKKDYCSLNTYDNSETSMSFTKETTFQEFALAGTFKELHCCAKEYRTIEWFKDDKVYPWALQVSRFILFPQSSNQTIYTQSVTPEDSGNYTCVLRNDEVVISHTIQLKVYEKVPDDPKITYISQDKSVAIGKKLRIFCEAFAGRVDLPDAHNEAVWRKSGPNSTLKNVPSHVAQIASNREDNQTFGVYLTIGQVKKEDYGDYVCLISKPGKTTQRIVSVREKVKEQEYINPNPVPVAKLLLSASVVLFACIASALLYVRYGLKIRVHLKDSLKPVEEDDGKFSDVLIAYSPKDSELAVGVLLPTLENQYEYKCALVELSANINTWYVDLEHKANECRRVIVLISPSALDDSWDSSGVLQALKQLQSLGSGLICVTLKELPKSETETKNCQGETLASVSRFVGVLGWERKDERFWYALRLRLPPKRRSDGLGKGKRLTEEPRESLNGLV